MRVLYFGSYSLNNPRNAVLINGLRENGVRVLECRDTSRWMAIKYIRLFFKHLKYIGKYDVMIVGFSGQELMFLAKIFSRKPIIFDVFTSHYMGYILDRQYFSPRSLRAKYYRFLDYWSCRLADAILLDTQAHINYFVREYGLPSDKFYRIWLGANTQIFHPRSFPKLDYFSVVFWGNFIPLQGVEYIIRAAKILENENVKFTLVGDGGQTFEANKQLATELGLKNVKFTGKLEWDDLHPVIAQADVCLGAFSNSPKADITIQNKIFESLASGKAVITVRTTALQELLRDGQECIMVNKADPQDLATKILQLKNNPDLKNRLADNGWKFFQENLTEKKLGEGLLKIIQKYVKASS